MLHTQLALLMLAATLLGVAGCGGSSKSGSTSSSSVASTSTPATTTATPTTKTSLDTAKVAPSVKVKIASGTPLAHHTWIVKGGEICGRLNAELAAIKVKEVGELPRVLPQAAAYERAAIVELAKLVPPSSKTADWQRFLDVFLQRAEDSDNAAELARLGDSVTQAPIFATVRALEKQMGAIAKHDGLAVCSPV